MVGDIGRPHLALRCGYVPGDDVDNDDDEDEDDD